MNTATIERNEVTVAGYARQALAGEAISTNDTDDRVEYDATDVAFGALTAGETISAAVIFDQAGGADSARVLIAYLDVSDVATNGGAVTLRF